MVHLIVCVVFICWYYMLILLIIIFVPPNMKKKIGEYIIELNHPIGEGSSARVYLCHPNKDTNAQLAVKTIEKQKIEADPYLQEAIKRQFATHHKLNHPHVVKLLELVETRNNIYIVQEFCEGGTLQEVLDSAGGRVCEEQATHWVGQICAGFSELVRKGVIHRDLKPQNLMLAQGKVKIGDFGFAKCILTQKQLLTSLVGSPIYMAPQILKGEKYTSKCDVWSLGIIFYQFLYGRFPWFSQKGNLSSVALLRKVLTDPLVFPEQPKVSPIAKEFIEGCLQTDQAERLSWLQIFEHKMFHQQFQDLAKEFRENYYQAAAMLNSLAQNAKCEQLIGAFLRFKTKALDYKQFTAILKWLLPKATVMHLSIMYEMFDKDGNGVIDFEEFIKAFQICDERVVDLLHQLIEQGLTHEQLQNKEQFHQASLKITSNEQIISATYKVMENIIFS